MGSESWDLANKIWQSACWGSFLSKEGQVWRAFLLRSRLSERNPFQRVPLKQDKGSEACHLPTILYTHLGVAWSSARSIGDRWIWPINELILLYSYVRWKIEGTRRGTMFFSFGRMLQATTCDDRLPVVNGQLWSSSSQISHLSCSGLNVLFYSVGFSFP